MKNIKQYINEFSKYNHDNNLFSDEIFDSIISYLQNINENDIDYEKFNYGIFDRYNFPAYYFEFVSLKNKKISIYFVFYQRCVDIQFGQDFMLFAERFLLMNKNDELKLKRNFDFLFKMKIEEIKIKRNGHTIRHIYNFYNKQDNLVYTFKDNLFIIKWFGDITIEKTIYEPWIERLKE